MCSCNKNRRVQPSAFNCANYGIADLNIYLIQYECVLAAGTYGSIGMSLSHVNGQITNLNAFIAVLTGNPNSTTHCGSVPLYLTDSVLMTSIGC